MLARQHAASRSHHGRALLTHARHNHSHRRFIDLRTSTGFSALHHAAFWGYAGVARVLMAAGADALLMTATSSTTEGFELVASGGSCALHLAAANGHRHVAAAILQAYVRDRLPACLRVCMHPWAARAGANWS